ncbi:MAG: TonB-dependent receptor [Bryobacterales bacterium]
MPGRILLLLLLAVYARAASMDGDITVMVRDPAGAPVRAKVTLLSWTSMFRAAQTAGEDGLARFRRVPLGSYGLEVKANGFETATLRLDVPSELPVRREVTLSLAAVSSSVTVESVAPLLDSTEPSQVLTVGRERLESAPAAPLGRGVIDSVTDLPGWLLEANAVLHPRGSEYDTQYVLDGVPVYDNRSIGFVPAFAVDELESIQVSTAGVPAEFGRRLGGVIELFPRRSPQLGRRSDVEFRGGTFATVDGAVSTHYQAERYAYSVGARAGHTNRYLDPPSLENFTNKASSAGGFARWEQDFGNRDRLTLYARANRVGFLVPNDLTQQAAGQRQDRRGMETTGQAHYQRTLSSSWLLSARGMARDVGARLWSNPASTPVWVDQDRGIRETVASTTLTWQGERQTVKMGGDFRTAKVHEQFLYSEAEQYPAIGIDFSERARSNEGSFFIQDQIRLGALSLNAGLRFDGYSFLVSDSAFSPRLAASYFWKATGLQFRAAYDRMFQTPPLENLLLSSTASALRFDGVDDVIPVPPSRANFYEVGVRKTIADALRLDVTHYWRKFDQYFDDDVFLNTGIGFPITFDKASIEGTEVRLEMPRWGRLSSYASWSNMHGLASSPVTGGLFIEGGEAEELRDLSSTFPITQDQRNTAAAMVRYEWHPRLATSLRARYGSGLPVELEDDDDDPTDEEGEDAAIPDAILRRVNFARGRVRPNFSLDFSLATAIWSRDQRSLRLQLDAVNLTNRLNVINFSGLFSGTALAPTRMVSLTLRTRF